MPKDITAMVIESFQKTMKAPVQGDKNSPALVMEYVAQTLLNNQAFLFDNPPFDGGVNISDERLIEWVAGEAAQEVLADASPNKSLC